VGGAYESNAGKIGDGTRHFQYPLMGPPRESETFHRIREEPPTRFVCPAPTLHARIGELRVAGALALELHEPRAGHPLGRV